MSRIVISAYPLGHKWIAEIQKPRMASFEYIHVFWVPAIHAGTTVLLKQLYNQNKL